MRPRSTRDGSLRFRRARAPIAFVTHACFLFSFVAHRPARASDGPPVEIAVEGGSPKHVEPSTASTEKPTSGGTELKSSAVASETTTQAPSAPIAEKWKVNGGIIGGDPGAKVKDNPIAGPIDQSGLVVDSLPTGGDKTGVSSQAITVPQGAGKIQGMGESFSAQLSTGIATFSVPFSLIPARGDAQPSLGLSYSSAGGHGLAGVGWEVGVPFIARQTDRGLPQYVDPGAGGPWFPGQDRFVFNGGQELVPICLVPTTGGTCTGALPGEVMPTWAGGWQYFRPRVEGGFLRFFWSPDHETWRVQDKSGVTMELGGDVGALETNPAIPTQIFRWNLSLQYDVHVDSASKSNNLVAYRYLHLGGQAYLSDIYDTPPRAGSASAPLSAHAHHTHLDYEARSDVTTSWRRGWPVTNLLRLRTVDVTSKTFEGDASSARELVRRYHLAYDTTSHVSLLESVQLEGKCSPNVFESSEALPESTSCPRLPAMTFGYQRVAGKDSKGAGTTSDLAGYESFDETVHALTASPPNSIDEELTDLFDVNSDALPDVVVTNPATYGGQHGLFLNGQSGAADTFTATRIAVVGGIPGADAGTITLKNANLAAGDLDGDGTVDLLHMPMVKQYAVYSPVGSGLTWTWQGRLVTTADLLAPKINFGKDAQEQHVVDANGDGLVDVVYVSGTEVQTYFSLGRLPGGDGQFGHGKWTSATTAELSADPVRMCVPWSGAPVRFSDAEIKLADMNGDGLADIVKLQKGNIQYWPGRGNGLWGTGALDDCPGGTFGKSRDVAMDSSPSFSGDVSGLRLDDVNGDGLDDLVQVRFTDVDVWLNVDGTGWTDRHVLASTPPAPGFTNRVRLVDINGSGTRDILWGDGGNYRYIDLQGGKRPWILTSVANGLGKTTELEYASSTELMLAAKKAGKAWSSTTPMPLHVVVRETEKDNLAIVGRPPGAYVTEYSYSNPVYDGRQREFRGFRDAEVKRIGDANSPTAITSSTFLLGECRDEDSKVGVDPCAVSQRWRDNPREALKGLPVVSESFDETRTVYLSTLHHTYRLRQLYAGLDGRAVRAAFESASDEYRYDNGPFVAAASPATPADVELEATVGAAPSVDVAPPLGITLRSAAGRAHLHGTVIVDSFGNRQSALDYGCQSDSATDACTTSDDVITTVTTPTPVTHPSGWLWRTSESYTLGAAGEHRHAQHVAYDALGQPTIVTAELVGTLPLDRFHETSGAAVAPAPSDASHDRSIFVGETRYDEFGNPIVQRGPNGRYRALGYDAPFADLTTTETVYVGPLAAAAEHGSTDLTASARYDRGLVLTVRVTDLHGELTDVSYDGFGRVLAVLKPDPDTVGAVSPLPAAIVEYTLADVLGKPYSLIHTQTLVGETPGDAKYRNAWAYVDGLGRTIVTLDQADPTAGDGGDFVANGLTEYDNKGTARRAYRAWFHSGDARAFPLATTPPSKYGRQRYDAFGRALETFNLDGTVSLARVYHALSSDAWDAADLAPGPHYGTPASERQDGHGRSISSIERIHDGSGIEARETRTAYLTTGEVVAITRIRVGKPDAPIIRWIRYDSLGRMVLNVEPNTTKHFSPDPTTDPSTMKAWRYAYDDAGDLVGTSDARGCGSNYHYDAGGRLVVEDYSPCLAFHAAYSSPNLETGNGTEVFYHYDTADLEASTSPASACRSELLKGRLASESDRASKTLTCFDGRGRVVQIARKVAKPGTPELSLGDRYAAKWWTQTAAYDGADRPVRESTGADVPELMGGDGKSEVITSYTLRDSVKSVGGSYGTIVDHVRHDADGLPLELQWGDVAGTTTTYSYDDRRRLKNVQTYRSPPSIWTSTTPTYAPAPTYGSGVPTTFQTLLEDSDFVYDEVDNPVEIRDYRIPNEWPAGAQPFHRKMVYDDLYRLTRIDHQFKAGSDAWVSPFQPENDGTATDPKLAKPSPHVAFDQRILWQSFAYDWLGNTTKTDDDAHGFFDRSIGAIGNGTAGSGPYQLHSAANDGGASAGARAGHLSAAYDDAGNLIGLAVMRKGSCLPVGAQCGQRFVYEWDEVGRLARARRWDARDPGKASDAVPTEVPAAELRYSYDGGDQRILKTATDAAGEQRHTVYALQTVELRRAEWDDVAGAFVSAAGSQAPYLFAHGVRLARVAYEPADVPNIGGARLHVVLALTDHLGSTSTEIDKGTGEVVERGSYQAYGGAESDYRPGRWKGERESYRFTGKEEDVEVGLDYFARRYLSAQTQRWLSADPAGIQGFSAANVYAYATSRPLALIDPAGLSEVRASYDPSAPVKQSGPGQYELAPVQIEEIDEPAEKSLGPGDALAGLAGVFSSSSQQHGAPAVPALGESSNGQKAAVDSFTKELIENGIEAASALTSLGELGLGLAAAKTAGPRVVKKAAAPAAEEAANKVPSALSKGVDAEKKELAKLGLTKNAAVIRPTKTEVESAAFKVIVGEPKKTSGGLYKGTIYDAVTKGSLIEIKSGSSVLTSSYQLRLQVFFSLTRYQKQGMQFLLKTSRPIEKSFSDWLTRWGVTVTGL